MKTRKRYCQCCGADAEQNYLRMTQTVNGNLMLLCEYCAMDEEQTKAKAARQQERRAS